jgi:kynurenine formamidase
MLDLSHPITAGMTVYPGDPEVRSREALSVAADGVAVTELHLGSHTGTHIDAPSHTIRGGRTIDEVPLDALSGDALVLRADRAGECRPIDGEMLGLERFDAVPPIVAICTGWDRHFGGELALRHPFLAVEAAERLWCLGMRVLVVDTLSPDPTAVEAGPPPATADRPLAVPDPLPVHTVVLGGGGAIVENVRGLDALGERARLGIFPLPLAGADGAPARVVAWRDEAR